MPSISVFGFVLCIIAMGLYADHRKQQLKLMGKMDDIEKNKLQQEINDLKQRLIVLERIVTDKSYALHEEISKLKNS